MDALHPYIGALQITEGVRWPWRGVGSDFHFGALQAWVSVPLVAFADTSAEVLARNAVFHALGVLPMAWAGWRLSGWGTAFFAASCYAAWPILVGHPIHGAYSYQAPVFVALSVAFGAEACVRPKRAWLIATAVSLGIAVSLHPIALTVAIAALLALPLLREHYKRTDVLWATATGALACSPWLVDNVLHALQRSASGAVRTPQDPSMLELPVTQLLYDALSQTVSGWAPITTAACLAAPALCVVAGLSARGHRLETGVKLVTTWTVGALLAFVSLVGLMNYVQPYHWAVCLPLLFIAAPMSCDVICYRWAPRLPAALGVAVGLASGGWAIATTHNQLPHLTFSGPPNVEQRAIVQAASDAITAHAEGATRTFAVLTDATGNTRGEPVALFLEQWLANEGDDKFPTTWVGDGPQAYVLASLSSTQWAQWAKPRVPVPWSTPAGPGHQIRLLAFPTTADAAQWLASGCGLLQRWPSLLVQGPQEGLGGLRGAPNGADPRLLDWARFCPADQARPKQ
jgi:hypothetical protein